MTTMFLACRNPLGVKDKVEYLQQSSGNPNIRGMQLDLSDLDSVRQFAQEFQRFHDRIDMLVCNAGVLAFERRETKQGFELGTLLVRFL
jgi:NAD(P)-dependent dehydrogenase (short-subunit alcohol dehydrogenase family)